MELTEAVQNKLADELRVRVGLEIGAILSRVPDRGAPVSEEMGAVLLSRVHEVLDALERAGCPVRDVR